MIIALRKGDGSFDTTPAPDAVLEAQRRPHRRRHARRGAPARRALRSGRGDGPVSVAVERLAGALAGLAGAPVRARAAVRRGARRLRDERRAPPRAHAQGGAARARAGARRPRRPSWPDVERAEVAGPGFLNLFLATAWYGEALAEILERGAAYGGGSAAAPEKVQVELVSANPTGPLTIGSARNGAYGDSVARLLEFAGHTVEREYYYNDAGAQMERFRALRRGAPQGRADPGGRLPGRVHRRARAGRRRPGAGDAGADRGDARALPRPHRRVDARERPSGAARRDARPHGHLHLRRGALGPLRGARRRQGPRARPLAGAGRARDLRGVRRDLHPRQVRARLRAPDLRPRLRPPGRRELVPDARADVRLRRVEGRGAALPARPPQARQARP